MAERFFLGLLIIITAAASLWISVFPTFEMTQFLVAALLGVLGLATLANIGSLRQSGALMPLYFVTLIAFEVFVFLLRGDLGLAFRSMALLSLVGLVVSFGIPEPRVAPPPKKASVKVESTKVVSDKPKKKRAKKTAKKKAKKKAKKR